MTNDLMTELQTLGTSLATNLTNKGVTASYTDGLTTLANKILTIPQSGGHCYGVVFDATSFIGVQGTGTVGVTIYDNYSPVSNASLTLTGSDNSTYSATTNSSGYATFTTSGTTGNTITYTLTYQGVTKTCTMTYIDYYWYDTCTVDNTSNYTDLAKWTTGTITATLSYDSTNQNYQYVGSGGDYFGGRVIPNTQGEDNIRIIVKVKINNTSAYNQCMVMMTDTLSNSSSTATYDAFRIRGDNKSDYLHNSGNEVSGSSSSTTVSGYWRYLVFERSGSSIVGKVYNDSMSLLRTYSYTTANTYTNPYYVLGLNTRYTSDTKNIALIQVEAIT